MGFGMTLMIKRKPKSHWRVVQYDSQKELQLEIL